MKHAMQNLAGLALSVGLASGAMADNVRASEPQSFIDFFFDAGYPAQLSEDGVGDPFIEFRYQGTVLPLWFYDCVENAGCQSVQFYFAYRLDEPTPFEALNDWNGEERRFTRAYRVDDGTVRLEMDVFTGADGLSRADFDSLLGLWLDRLTEFEDFIGW
jgi:Putative bacterial sensory transduction regulator